MAISGEWSCVCACGQYDIRIVATGKLYRIGDLTYQRMVKGAEPTPYGWLEIDEDEAL